MQSLRLWMVIVLIVTGSVSAQEIKLPQNPLEGRIVFEEKKCIECHAIGGFGGTVGPDLSRQQFFGSALELASVIWNHAPQMNRKFRQLRMNRPQLTGEEMLDLFGFLYYLRYLGEPGGVAKGKRLLEAKGCVQCHTVAGKGGTVGPDLENVQRYAAPLFLIQAMWNHGPAMQEQLKKSGMKFPVLTGQDIADIAAYLRQATTGSTEMRMSPGNPAKGKSLFEEKHCSNCHLGEGKPKRVEPGLIRIDLKKGVTEVASTMWNHGSLMMERMKRESIEWPHFEENEMADLIAYIYFLGFEDKPGDDRRGESVFRKKGCVDCHKVAGGGRGPDLSSIKRFDSPIRMIQLMWNHASEMEDLLITQNKKWPGLSTYEMRDLYAYLKRVTQK
ncbi:MAG: cytochrome c [Bacteroidota bacterium]